MTIQFEFAGFKNSPKIDTWRQAEKNLRAVCANLSDLRVIWEYPGFAQITTKRGIYSFGTCNGFYGYDGPETPSSDLHPNDKKLPLTATLDELTDWIRKVVAK